MLIRVGTEWRDEGIRETVGRGPNSVPFRSVPLPQFYISPRITALKPFRLTATDRINRLWPCVCAHNSVVGVFIRFYTRDARRRRSVALFWIVANGLLPSCLFAHALDLIWCIFYPLFFSDTAARLDLYFAINNVTKPLVRNVAVSVIFRLKIRSCDLNIQKRLFSFMNHKNNSKSSNINIFIIRFI